MRCNSTVNIKIISVLLSVISLLIVNTQAANLPLKNIDGREEQGSIVSKPFTGSTILTKNTTNLPIPTVNTTIYNSSVYEFENIQGKAVTTTRSSYYSSGASYVTAESSQSLSPGAIAGIVIGVILLLCCCSVGTYKRQELWELRRIY